MVVASTQEHSEQKRESFVLCWGLRRVLILVSLCKVSVIWVIYEIKPISEVSKSTRRQISPSYQGIMEKNSCE
jgi:hypothetical protein